LVVAPPRSHYENFPVASILLPARLRRPIANIYRFARSADDIADEGDLEDQARLDALARYREELARIAQDERPESALFQALAGTIAAHRLPLQLFFDLLDAFTQDVTKKRYADFSEVLDYSRRSANPVGRLLLHLFGKATAENLQWSDSICTGLQLVNFWQDIEIDYLNGRVYLPQDDLQRFAVAEQQIASRKCDSAWRALIGFQIERARALLLSGSELGRRLPGRIGIEIRVTTSGGLRVLEKLEAAGCDMFRSRPVLRWHDWPLLLMRSVR